MTRRTTMQGKGKDEDSFLISFHDIFLICKNSKYKIIGCILFFSILLTFYALITPQEYKAEASFREKSKAAADTNKSQSLAYLLGSTEKTENAAISLMKSRRLISQVIVKRGLQVRFENKNLFSGFLQAAKDNLLNEWSSFTHSLEPIKEDLVEDLKIRDILYSDEIPLKFSIQLISENGFKLLDGNHKEIGQGMMGVPFVHKKFQFTLVKNHSGPLHQKLYRFTLLPLNVVVEKLTKKIQVNADQTDKTLLKLTFTDADRFEASGFINDLMDLYIQHLKNEQLRITTEQIAYLQKRQDETDQKLKSMMEEHALALSSNMATMESLFSTQQTYSQRLLLIDLELKRLKSAAEEGITYYDRYSDGADPGIINQVLNDIRSFKQQADSIEIALRRAPKDPSDYSMTFSEQIDEFEKIKEASSDAKQILAAVEKGHSLPQLQLIENPRYMIKDWYQKINDKDKINSRKCIENCKANFKEYLANIIHLLEVEEKLLHERLTHQQNGQLEFQGIDLATANQLYINYSKNLNEIESEILHYKFIINQMQDPEFEPSSLSSVLTDPVSQEIIVKASDLILMLRDEKNRSQKELDRMREDLAQQRNFLSVHVRQMLQLLKLKEKLFKEKILSVQNAQLELIQQKITILEKHLSDYIESRILNFKQEKLSIEQQQQALKQEMEKMPSQWASEKLIDQHLEMSRKIVEEITGLVESKNISNNLDITQSAPLDDALPPIHPQKPKLLIMATLGAILGGLVSAVFFIMRATVKGISVSQENLKALGFQVAGRLSRSRQQAFEGLLNSDLETLRRLAANIVSGKKEKLEGETLLLLMGQGIDYSHDFAMLLGTQGYKILLLNISFDKIKSKGNDPGLLEYLKGEVEDVRVRKGEEYDLLLAEGFSRFSNELISSVRFWHLLEKFRKEYQWIILASHASPCTSEGANLLRRFDYAAITIMDENLQALIESLKPIDPKGITFLFPHH